jgi:GMP synthase (glutamine-hydrolysing)
MDCNDLSRSHLDVAILRHVPFEGPGLLGDALGAAGWVIRHYDLSAGDLVPSTADADAFVILGGPMSANDPLPYRPGELQLIRDAHAAGKPLLGICLGAQLIAMAAGARVYRNPVKEIGWFDLYWRPAAAQDCLFNGLQGSEKVFQWHGETFDLPAGAEWLAYSDACHHQAFRLGSSTYGLQFHIEVSPSIISDWLQQDANCGDTRELDHWPDPHAHAARQAELAALIFGRWARMARERRHAT